MDTNKQLRSHLLELLDGTWAHIYMQSVVESFPLTEMNSRPANSPHSAWELLEHIRIAQWDIVGFSRDPKHISPDWPSGYWPVRKGTPADWRRSVKQIVNDLGIMKKLVANTKNDLFAPFLHGDGQTLLREAMLLADHNSYHLGQLMLIKRMIERDNK